MASSIGSSSSSNSCSSSPSSSPLGGSPSRLKEAAEKHDAIPAAPRIDVNNLGISFDENFDSSPRAKKKEVLENQINILRQHVGPIVHKRLKAELNNLQAEHDRLTSDVERETERLRSLGSKLEMLNNTKPATSKTAADLKRCRNEIVSTQLKIAAINNGIRINSQNLQGLKGKVVRYANIHNIAAGILSPKESLSKKEFVKLRNGAIKQVWTRDDKPDRAFYTALGGGHKALVELQSEAKTALDIQQRLNKKVLSDFISTSGLSPNGKKIAAQYPSLMALAAEIGELRGIGKADEAILLRKLDKKTVEDARKRGQNLAIDLRTLGNEGVRDASGKPQFTLEVPLADDDLENLLKDPSLYSSSDLIDIIGQLMQGAADLQDAGYVHGDMKPENVLVIWNKERQRYDVKISDWGKAKLLSKPGQEFRHEGNTRFAAWESRVSQPAEVCAIGIQMIRILEQQLLKGGRYPLIAPQRPGNGKAAQSDAKNRRGFEVFVIESADFNAIEADSGNPLQTVGHRIFQAINYVIPNRNSRSQRMAAEKDRYIDALSKALKDKGFAVPNDIDALCQLIKDMTHIDPAKRPLMRDAVKRFGEIQQRLLAMGR